MDFLTRTKRWVVTPERGALFIVVCIAGAFLLWIVEQNIAFFGTRQFAITDFSNLPPGVTLAGKTTFASSADALGKVGKPNQDSSLLQFSFPRGFVTATTILHYESDVERVVTLDARVQPGEEPQSWVYRHPKVIPESFTAYPVLGGRVYLREPKPEGVELWDIVKATGHGVALGPYGTMLIQPNSPAATGRFEVPFTLRGSSVISAYLPAGQQEVRFTKRDLNYLPGEDTYAFSVHGPTGRIARVSVRDDGNVPGVKPPQSQQVVLNVPNSGMYQFVFTGNNEDSTIEKFSFTGGEVALQMPVTFGSRRVPVVLHTDCPRIEFEAIKAGGFQTVAIGEEQVRISEAAKPYVVSTTQPRLQTITIPRGDLRIRGACSLQLQAHAPLLEQVQDIARKFTVLQQPSAKAIADADVVIDSYLLPKQRGSTLIATASYALKELAASGTTFRFGFSFPGYMASPEASVRLKQFTVTAERPAFRLK